MWVSTWWERAGLFLVPPIWSPSNLTLVLPDNESVRLQFQVQNGPGS